MYNENNILSIACYNTFLSDLSIFYLQELLSVLLFMILMGVLFSLLLLIFTGVGNWSGFFSSSVLFLWISSMGFGHCIEWNCLYLCKHGLYGKEIGFIEIHHLLSCCNYLCLAVHMMIKLCDVKDFLFVLFAGNWNAFSWVFQDWCHSFGKESCFSMISS